MKIAIAGYGAEGKANYEYWHGLGHEVTIVDEADLSPFGLPYKAASILGDGAFKKLDDFEMVVRTAGLAPGKLKTKGKVWSASNEFFSVCPAPIIGVTGTKGKGTTASLITSSLRAAGKTVHLVGNIGVPALTELPSIKPDDIVVYELSSFQLWDLKKSPHIAVVLMIETDHLDVHKDMAEYVGAKANIRRYQQPDDICIYHPSNHFSKEIASSSREGKTIRYATADDGGVYVKANTFFARNIPLGSIETLGIVGAHNVENACAALTAALYFTDDAPALMRGLSEFTGLPHRLKLVRELEGIQYFDDSIATTPGSAIAAVRAIDRPRLLILGGHDKGADYGELIKLCKETATHILAVGSNGTRLTKLATQSGAEVTLSQSKTMAAIVDEARRLVPAGGAVILSPAAASFDMFKSYADRGEQFVTAVEALS